ncbi:MAG: TIR domain-containing protein [Candidatus Competibacteraceae bacterium]
MSATPRIFISYSHDNETWKDRLVSQLGVLEHEGLLSVWEDRRIDAGDNWLPEIETAIDACNVALLLISAKFLTSKFILGREVPALLQRREQAGVRVIPVILESCAWTRVSWLKTIQARPKDGKPLSGMSDYEADAALAALAGEIADLLVQTPPLTQSARIDLTKLPAGAADFLGREVELKLLDDAWADNGHTQVVELVAPGGVGKTALVKRWLDCLKADSWRGAQRVYGWSFFSQGTSDDRQASDDNFLSAALGWFAVAHDPAMSPWDKGKRLAEAVSASRTLLVLDGVEPLQYPPGPMAGQLRAPGLKALLTQLVSSGQPGLCILTTRERIQDLAEYERCDDYSTGAVIRHDLGNLSEADGARLLHKLGVRRAGAAAISRDDAELKQASREVHGHALTLRLLGGLLVAAYTGDIRQSDKVEFDQADEETYGGKAFTGAFAPSDQP